MTPDGTEIYSKTRNDLVEHTDANGQEYSVDGGLEYLKRSGAADYEEMSLSLGDCMLEELVTIATWGTRGKDGKGELTQIPIYRMETDHIQAVLRTQKNIRDALEFLMRWELSRRMKEANGKIFEVISEFKDE